MLTIHPVCDQVYHNQLTMTNNTAIWQLISVCDLDVVHVYRNLTANCLSLSEDMSDALNQSVPLPSLGYIIHILG